MPLPAPRTWDDGNAPESTPHADDLNLDWRDSWDFFLTQRPMILLHHTTGSQTIDATGIAINFTTEVLKRGGMIHSTVTNTSRVQVPYTGQYHGYLYLGWGTVATTTSKFSARLRKNGTTVIARVMDLLPQTTAGGELHGTFTADLVAGDYVEFFAIETAATAPTNTGAINRPKFAMWYEGDYQ